MIVRINPRPRQVVLVLEIRLENIPEKAVKMAADDLSYFIRPDHDDDMLECGCAAYARAVGHSAD